MCVYVWSGVVCMQYPCCLCRWLTCYFSLFRILFFCRKGGTPLEVNGTTQINENRKEEEEKLLTEDHDLT